MLVNTNKSLTTAEIVSIWNSYSYDTLAICVFDYFLSKVQDVKTRALLEFAQNLAKQHISNLGNFFKQECFPIPQGFNQDDVNVDTPPLFTDDFYLFFINSTVNYGMVNYAMVLNNVSRPDLRDYYSKCIAETIELYNKDVDLLLAKGLFIEAPRVELVKDITFVKTDNFLGGWFGQPRTILAREVTGVYINILYNIINKPMFSGFGQVAASKQVRDFMYRGRDIASKHIEILSTILSKENVPVPSTSESFVTDSTTAPFSEKLMVFLMLGLTQFILTNLQTATNNSLRKDLQTDFIRLTLEFSKYLKEGLDIMINNEWFEQPPQVINCEKLV